MKFMTAAEALRRAKARIEDPEHWCQESSALDAEGFEVYPTSDDAVKWCAAGAAPLFSTRMFLLEAAQRLFECGIVSVNDALGHAAVMKMYDLAIEMAEENESG